MGTKTVSITDKAYARLRAVRSYPAESFSAVVLRATWLAAPPTAAQYLKSLRQRRRLFTAGDIARIEELRQIDVPPADKWDAD